MSVKENVARAKSDYDRAYDVGKQAERDAFWGVVLDNGKRTNFNRGFAGFGWTDETCKPPCVLRPSGNASAYSMFNTSRITNGFLNKTIGLDLSYATGTAAEIFANCWDLTYLPLLDFSNTTSISNGFAFCWDLVTIEKLILPRSTSDKLAFTECYSLVNVIVEGVQSANFDIHWSTNLSKASITSIVNALSTTTTGLTVTLSKTAVDTAFATTAGGTDGSTSAEWLALFATRSNWTIALA